MKKLRLGWLLMLMTSLGACQSGPDATGGGDGKALAALAAPRLETQAVKVVGENYCLGCALKKGRGAAAQCSAYGHRHALRVESAKGAQGQDLPELVGQTLHYLDNDQSAPLLKGTEFHGARVVVDGTLFADERTLQVAAARAP